MKTPTSGGTKLWQVLVFIFIALIIIIGLAKQMQNQRHQAPESLVTFDCAINCMDGRIQDAVKRYMCRTYGITHVDMITEAGPNKILAENKDTAIINNIKKRLEVSAHHHGAKVVAIVGHAGCAINPANKGTQIGDLQEAKKVVEQFGLNMEIILLWVDEDFETVHKIE